MINLIFGLSELRNFSSKGLPLPLNIPTPILAPDHPLWGTQNRDSFALGVCHVLHLSLKSLDFVPCPLNSMLFLALTLSRKLNHSQANSQTKRIPRNVPTISELQSNFNVLEQKNVWSRSYSQCRIILDIGLTNAWKLRSNLSVKM